MPKANPSPRVDNKFFVLTSGKKRVIIPRPKTHEDALVSAKRHFPSYDKSLIRFTTDALPFLDEEEAEVSPESWQDVLPLIQGVKLVLGKPEGSACEPCKSPLTTPARVPAVKASMSNTSTVSVGSESNPNQITLNLLSSCGKHDRFYRVSKRTRWASVFRAFERHVGAQPGDLNFNHDGLRLDESLTVGMTDVWDGDIIDVVENQVGGKPVIYLIPPSQTTISATVSLTLVPQWSFSAVYPTTPSKHAPTGEQHITWTVQVRIDGTLVDVPSGAEVAYLFWEAHTNPSLHTPDSPPTSRPGSPSAHGAESLDYFNPIASDLAPENSVVLPISSVAGYLDMALKALDLHVEARTSFITYWLPSLQKHRYIALRFISQAAYERAATLSILPAPDVVQRVFMLFKGVELHDSNPVDYGKWSEAAERSKDDVKWWRGVVGFKGEAGGVMNDDSLFRVLEWGGMEVIRQ